MAKTWQKLIRWASAPVVRGLVRIGRHGLSPRRSVLLGRVLAKIAAPFLRRERRRVYHNLDIAFDGNVPFKRGDFFRRTLANFGRAAFDTAYASGKWPDRACELFDRAELNAALDGVEEAYSRYGRLIVVTAHIGNWELATAALDLRFDTSAVARELSLKPYQDAIMEVRGRFGYRIFLQEDPVMMLVRFLKGGGVLVLAPDQDITHTAGMFVPFFGKDAYTPVGPAALSALTKTCILPVFCVYDGGRYRLRMGKPIEPPAGRTDETIFELARAWQIQIEKVIRRCPDQWAWFHRRWKTRPEDIQKDPS